MYQFHVQNNNNGEQYLFYSIQELTNFLSKTVIDYYNENKELPIIGLSYEEYGWDGDFTIEQLN